MKQEDKIYASFEGMPPCDNELERYILGTLLQFIEAQEDGLPLLKTDMFYNESHQTIFNAIASLANEKHQIDIVEVITQLRKINELEKIGGPSYITALTNASVTTSGFERKIRILTQYAMKRAQIKMGADFIKNGYDLGKDVFDAQNEMENGIAKLNEMVIGNNYEENLSEIVDEVIKNTMNPKKNNGHPTGNSLLTRVTGGWQPGEFVLLAARPSMGKTTRAIQYGIELAKQKIPFGFFSLEMAKLPMAQKILNYISEIDSEAFKSKNLTHEEMAKISNATEIINDLPFYLNTETSINPNYIRSVCRTWKKKYGVKVIAIDYIQLMQPNDIWRGMQTNEKVASISTALKNIAKELQITIIALSQLSRECEARQNKRPMPSDLRDSGQLEQDADLIMMMYRPSVYYGADDDPQYGTKHYSHEIHQMLCETIIAKNRMGPAQIAILEWFDKAKGAFKYDEPEKPASIQPNIPF